MNIKQAIISAANTQETYSKHSGIRVTKIGNQYCEAEVTLAPYYCNHYGTAHGGLMFTMCDMAAGIAVSYNPNNTPFTLSSSIEFLASTKSGVIRAVGTCVKRGKSVAFAEAKVYDDNGQLLATASFTYYFADLSKVKANQIQ
jgi:acyl-CoA thioesterase